MILSILTTYSPLVSIFLGISSLFLSCNHLFVL
nr:MAG TPA: hypothetical protein [Caudoviricetes sp.]